MKNTINTKGFEYNYYLDKVIEGCVVYRFYSNRPVCVYVNKEDVYGFQNLIDHDVPCIVILKHAFRELPDKPQYCYNKKQYFNFSEWFLLLDKSQKKEYLFIKCIGEL